MDAGGQVGRVVVRRRSWGRAVGESVGLVLVALVLSVLVKTFLLQVFWIPSGSMLPTLALRDRIAVDRVSYQLRDPERGEVVVFSRAVAGEPPSLLDRAGDLLVSGLGATADQEQLVKRVIGLPGETVEIRDGAVHVDGRPLAERATADGGYLQAAPGDDFGPVAVPDGRYFLMGDNRDGSDDSRGSLGTIPREDVVGRAVAVIWPVTRLGDVPGP